LEERAFVETQKESLTAASKAMIRVALSLLRQDDITHAVSASDEQFTLLMEGKVA
jgi:hypothetical protein